MWLWGAIYDLNESATAKPCLALRWEQTEDNFGTLIPESGILEIHDNALRRDAAGNNHFWIGLFSHDI